jgi:hypothetical protein
MSLSGTDKALMYALGGLARGGATRGGYTSMLTYVSIGGARARVRIADLSIRDLLDEVPNTCQLTVFGQAPALGATLAITVGSLNAASRLFGGKVLSVVQSYLGQKPANVAYQVNGIDYTWQATQHLVIGQYVTTSVTAIAKDLIARYAEGVTTQHIAANLAGVTIDAISFTNVTLADALSQLCSRFGGYWNIDYLSDLHLFTTEADAANPDPLPLTPTHPSLANLTISQDLSQVVTRVFVEGGGGTALVDVQPGDTMIPMDTIGWYQTGGGQLHIAPQRLSYTGLWAGGLGSLVGPGVVPSTAPGVTPTTGTGVDAGAHNWAYTWVTAAGETLPSPLTTASTQGISPPISALAAAAPVLSGVPPPTTALTAGAAFGTGVNAAIAAPSTAVNPNNSIPSSPNAGMDFGTYDYVVTFYTYSGETTPGPVSPTVTVSDPNHTIVNVQNLPLGPADTTVGRKIYRRLNGAGPFYFVKDMTNNLGAPLGETSFGDAVPNASVGPAAPTVNTSGAGGVLNPPATFLTVSYGGTGSPGNIETGTYDYEMTYQTAQGETTPGPISLSQNAPNPYNIISVTLGSSTPPASVVNKVLYRRQNGTGSFKRVANLPPTLTVYGDGIQNGALGPVAPTVNTAGAGNIEPGIYDYVVTFLNAAGETTPGPISNAVTTTPGNNQIPLSNIPLGLAGVTKRSVYRRKNSTGTFNLEYQIPDNVTTGYTDWVPTNQLGPAAPPANTTGSAYVEPGTYDYAVTFSNAAGQTTPGPISNAVTTDVVTNIIGLTSIPVGPAGVTARSIYRRKNGGALGLLTALGDNVTTAFTDIYPTGSINGTAPPGTNTTLASRFTLTVSVGTGATTARRLYRTAAGGTQLKLLTTLADNATTSYLDALADASLGANVPTADTSGLQQPLGTVLAGSPSLILAGMSAGFRPAGGWVIVGNGDLLIRYSGISGNSLTGIPPTGVGAITTSISYGAMATAAPLILGIPSSGTGSILYLIHQGDELDLLVTCDDVPAQTALKALTGGTGIREGYLQDRRIAYTEALARGRAELADRSTALVEVRYTCRDPLTRSGATISVGLPAPTNLAGSFKIQDVTIAAFSGVPGQPPTYTVLASSQRYSLDDLLRMARGTVGA